jgi:hypothetical protein
VFCGDSSPLCSTGDFHAHMGVNLRTTSYNFHFLNVLIDLFLLTSQNNKILIQFLLFGHDFTQFSLDRCACGFQESWRPPTWLFQLRSRLYFSQVTHHCKSLTDHSPLDRILQWVSFTSWKCSRFFMFYHLVSGNHVSCCLPLPGPLRRISET